MLQKTLIFRYASIVGTNRNQINFRNTHRKKRISKFSIASNFFVHKMN